MFCALPLVTHRMHSLVSTRLNIPGERSSALALPRAAPLPIPSVTLLTPAPLEMPQALPGPPPHALPWKPS